LSAAGRLDGLRGEGQAERGPGAARAAREPADRIHHVAREQPAHERHGGRLRRVVVDFDDRLGAAGEERVLHLLAEARWQDHGRAHLALARERERRRSIDVLHLERRIGADR
jgi:hypothetical protein